MSWVIWTHAMKRRFDFLEAIESLQAGPGDFVDHKQLAEALQLDLQIVEDELEGMEQAQLIELKPTIGVLYVALSTAGRRLLRERAEKRMRLPSAREAQQWILRILLDQPPRSDRRWTTDGDLAAALQLDQQFVRDNLDEPQAQNLVKLQQPVDMGGVIIVGLTAPGRIKAREPDYAPHPAHTEVKHVSTGGGNYVDTGGGDYAGRDIDKRQGAYFYDAGGDINFGAVQNQQDLIVELEKLRADLSKAAEDPAIDAEVVLDAENQVRKAIVQVKKPDADKKTILDRLNEAKALLTGVGAAAGAIAALVKAAELVQKLF